MTSVNFECGAKLNGLNFKKMNQFGTPRSKGHTRSFSYSGSCHKENVPQSNLPSVNQSLSLLKKQPSLLKKVGSTSVLSDYNAVVGDNGYSVHKIIKSMDVKSMACANEQEVWCGDRRGEITVSVEGYFHNITIC